MTRPPGILGRVRTVPFPVAAPRAPRADAGRPRPSDVSRRARAAAPVREGRPTRPARSTRATVPSAGTPAGRRAVVSDDERREPLRDRAAVVAAAAAVCALLAIALLSSVPPGLAVLIGFVPTLAGGWFFVAATRPVEPGVTTDAARVAVALLVAHAAAALPVALAIVAAG